MFYSLLKPIARLAFLIFCRKIIINQAAILRYNGPILIACNHPNSFLDSVILDVIFKKPVWSLARGDVFRNSFVAKFLKDLKMLPVYRTSEGVENLQDNYATFEACLKIFKQNGIIHIFSEGKCINEWHLRPLKKGTARLAIRAWEENIPLKVIPAGINYSSFRRFGKNIFLNFGEPVTAADIDLDLKDGLKHQAFNKILTEKLEKLVFEIPKADKKLQAVKLSVKIPLIKKILLAIPAIAGYLLHFPLYFPLQKFAFAKAGHNDHYDSILTTLLVILYPVYLLLISFLLVFISGSWWPMLIVLLMPFTAWAYTQLKTQTDP